MVLLVVLVLLLLSAISWVCIAALGTRWQPCLAC
jgi:hypothetical protein